MYALRYRHTSEFIYYVHSHALHHARGGARMVHTYEVFVDIVEFDNPRSNHFERGTTRYEIKAESRERADGMAILQAKQ